MQIHEGNFTNKCSLSAFCRNFCSTFCSNDSEQMPLTRSSTPYQVLSKTRKRASIFFPCRLKEQDLRLLLNFPLTTPSSKATESFGLNPYEFYPKNELFILEKYPYFMLCRIRETNLSVTVESSSDSLRIGFSNEDLSPAALTDIFINYLGFKLSETLSFDLNFVLYMHSSSEASLTQLTSLQNFSDFLIKFDQTFLFHPTKKDPRPLQSKRTHEILKERESRSSGSLRSLEDTKKPHTIRKTKDFEEKDVVLGRIRAFRGVKTQADLVLINFYQNVDLIRLGSYKEILIKTIFKSMAFSRNLAILLHKSFPVDLIPEIFDTCWSFFREEPKNFAAKIEILLINNVFEGFFVFWGDISLISYPDASDFLMETLYSKQATNEETMVAEQKKLLEKEFHRHGLRIFQKVIFSFKDFERVEEGELLFHLLSFLLNNNIISFHELKMFSFFQKLITSSVKSQYFSQRRISQESRDKLQNSNDESSSFIEKSQLSRDKFKKSSDKTPNSIDDMDLKSLTFTKKVAMERSMKREVSFKTVYSLKMKDQSMITSKDKDKEFNLVLKSSEDSNNVLEFSSYSEKADSDIEQFSKDYKVHKIENMKRMYKSSWSFSFD